MIKYIVLIGVLSLTACAGYNHPLGGVEKMSADTLCYRAAYAKDDPAIAAEIARRRLNCARIMDDVSRYP